MSSDAAGSIVWCDLTVPNAESVKDFYSSVVGWQANPTSMGDYDDFTMQIPGTSDGVAGICHAKGGNADIPSQWLLYFKVDDLDQSLKDVERQGGKAITAMKHYGDVTRYIIIEDPAGAVCALFEDKSLEDKSS